MHLGWNPGGGQLEGGWTGVGRAWSLRLSQVEKSTLREALRTLILMEDGQSGPRAEPSPSHTAAPEQALSDGDRNCVHLLASLPLGSFSVRSVEKRVRRWVKDKCP